MSKIALFTIAYAVLGLENLLDLTRTEADRPEEDLSIVDPASGLLFHGAVFMDVGQPESWHTLIGSSRLNRLIE